MKNNRLYSHNAIDKALEISRQEIKRSLFSILKEYYLDEDFSNFDIVSSIKINIEDEDIKLHLKICDIWTEIKDEDIEKFPSLEKSLCIFYDYLNIITLFDIKNIQYNHTMP